MIFRNINSFRALPTAEGVTHFAFDERDQAPFCGHGHSDCVCTSGGLGPPRDLPSLRSTLSRGCLGQRLWMPRPMAGDGFCAAHLSREPARFGVVAVFALGGRLPLAANDAWRHPRMYQFMKIATLNLESGLWLAKQHRSTFSKQRIFAVL